MEFKLVSDYAPMGDQPEAIKRLVADMRRGVPSATLHGVTGSGKTFTMANVIAQLNGFKSRLIVHLIFCTNEHKISHFGKRKNIFP